MSKRKEQTGTDKNFQALVLAENLDNYEDFYCLKPCPIESPMEKTLQLLEKNGFTEIFIFCTYHVKEVEEFVALRKTRGNRVIKVIYDFECNTFASIMRTIYTRKLMSEDFLMIQGHTVSDADLT